MFGDMQEILVIFVIALIVIGPKKLPEFARQLGRIVGQLKRAFMEAKFELGQEIEAEARKEDIRKTNEDVLQKRSAAHNFQDASGAGPAPETKAPGAPPVSAPADEGMKAGAEESPETGQKDVNG